MQMGMVGLGRMGSSMVRRLMRGGHECVHALIPHGAFPLRCDDRLSGYTYLAARSSMVFMRKTKPSEGMPRSQFVLFPPKSSPEEAVLPYFPASPGRRTFVKYMAREGAKRPTRPSDCNGGLGSAVVQLQ